MRILIISLLAVTGFQASALQPTCAKALERMHTRYFDEIETARTTVSELKWGGSAIAGTAALCLLKTKSLIVCGLTLGAAGAVDALYANKVLNRIKALEDGYKMYEAYYRIRGENLEDEAVHNLMRDVAASPAQATDIAMEYLMMVDSGELCDGGQSVTKSWEDVVDQLKSKRSKVALLR